MSLDLKRIKRESRKKTLRSNYKNLKTVFRLVFWGEIKNLSHLSKVLGNMFPYYILKVGIEDANSCV